MIVALLRHASTAWNEAGRMQGRADPPLSATGRASLAGRRLPLALDGARWVASPARRAQQTAAMIGMPDAPVVDALVEMDWGAWEGRTLADLRCDPDFVAAEARGLDFQPPGGESPRAVMQRAHGWLMHLRGEAPVVAVTHKGVIRAVLCLAYDWDMLGKPPVKLDWSRLHLFAVDGAAVRPHRMNLALAP